MEHLGTPSSPWSDQEDEKDPEYPEQSDNPREHSNCDSPTEGNNENTPALPQSEHENPEVSINTGYPDMQDTNAGSPGALETNDPSDIGKESILAPQQATLTPQHADTGFVDITHTLTKSQQGLGKMVYAMCSCPGRVLKKR